MWSGTAEPAETGAVTEPLVLLGADRPTARTVAPLIARLGGIALLFVVWEIAARAGWLDERTLGAPSSVVGTGWDLLRDRTLPRALWASSQRVLWAMVVGAPIGAVLALVAGLCRPGDAIVDSNMQILRYVPIVAVQPLLILWVGVGETTKVILLSIGVAFPVYLNTQHAIRSIDARHDELADVLGLTAWTRIRRVVLPGAAGGFLLGLRYAAGVAWLLLFFAEQTNADEGLGRLMVNALAFGKTDVIVLVIVVYTLLGIAVDVTIRAAERVALRWRTPR